MMPVKLLKDDEYDTFLRATIRRARKTLYLSIFSADLRSESDRNFELKMLIHELGQAKHDGVDVRLLFSDPTVGTLQRSANLPFFRFAVNRGIPCRISRPANRKHFHAKLCLADDTCAVFGSHNLSFDAFRENAELSVVVADPEFIAAQRRQFIQHWARAKSSPGSAPLNPSSKGTVASAAAGQGALREHLPGYWNTRRPEDPRWAAQAGNDEAVYQRITGHCGFELESAVWLWNRQYSAYCRQALEQARKTITLCTSVFSSSPSSDLFKLAQLLCRKAREGVAVQLLIGNLAPSRHALTAARFLQREGVQLRIQTRHGRMHRNMMVVDASQCIVGSHNWTPGSLFRNQELSLAGSSKALAKDLEADFGKLWNEADPVELRDTQHTAAACD